jgi:hypothetical protein
MRQGVNMCVNAKIRLVETSKNWGRIDKREWWRG